MLESTQKPALDRGSNHRTDATGTESSRVALSRYGSVGELPAWLPMIVTPGHEGLGWCVPWDNTRPLTRECTERALASYNENSGQRDPRIGAFKSKTIE